MSQKWFLQLQDSKPNLALIAAEMNKSDGFVMYKKSSKRRLKERKKKTKKKKTNK